jgi:hypothetical protein
MAELEADPEFVARRTRQQDELRRCEAELRTAEEALVEDLRRAGCLLESVWDLVNTKLPYPQAVPILFEHFTRPYPAPIREGIARALTVREARPYWSRLRDLYQNETERRVKDALAVALSGIADDTRLSEVIAMASNTLDGPSRIFFLGTLGRSRDPSARQALMILGGDPELAREAQAQMKKRRAASVRADPCLTCNSLARASTLQGLACANYPRRGCVYMCRAYTLYSGRAGRCRTRPPADIRARETNP